MRASESRVDPRVDLLLDAREERVDELRLVLPPEFLARSHGGFELLAWEVLVHARWRVSAAPAARRAIPATRVQLTPMRLRPKSP